MLQSGFARKFSGLLIDPTDATDNSEFVSAHEDLGEMNARDSFSLESRLREGEKHTVTRRLPQILSCS